MFLKRCKLIGLDINTSYVRWVQIYHNPDQIALVKAYGTIVLEEYHGGIANLFKLPGLQALFATHAIAIALPDSSVQKTTLCLDANLSMIQLRKIFRSTAASLCNQPIKNIHYQYQILGFSKNQPTQLNFLLVGVSKAVIEKSLHFLKTCCLMPKLIDVESFAKQRGEETLKNHQITLEKNVDADDFLKQSEDFKVSLGLAMHPGLKNLW